MCNMSRFGLEKEQQVAVFLGLLIVGENALLGIGRIIEMAGNFILLHAVSDQRRRLGRKWFLTSSSAIRFWISNAIRESR